MRIPAELQPLLRIWLVTLLVTSVADAVTLVSDAPLGIVFYKCGRKGHFVVACRSTRETAKCSSTSASTFLLATMATTNSSIETKEASTASDYSRTIHGQEAAATASSTSLAAGSPPHHVTIPVRVYNVYVSALVDSGSTSSFLHPDIVKRLAVTTYPSQDNIVMASSHASKTLGQCFVDLEI